MAIFKKEKRVVALVLKHIQTTADCVQETTSGLTAYLSAGRSALEQTDGPVNRLETEADTILREIRDMLYSGAYLPLIRGDIYRLMSTVDGISNKAEGCFDFFHNQMPDVPEDYRTDFSRALALTSDCFSAFQQALESYFGPKDDLELVRTRSNEVGELESQIDELERSLTSRLFDSSLDLALKIHLRQAIRRITAISDSTEDAADELELISLKSIV